MSRLRLERAAWRDVEPSSWERRPMLAAARAARVSPSTELRVSNAEVAVFPRSTEMKSSETSGDEGRIDDRRAAWLRAFKAVRDETERRAAPLSPEDQVIQSMPDASPTKWHRAHTTWFFEQFLLRAASCPATGRSTSASPFCSIPTTWPPARGMRGRSAACITRPAAAEVAAYRAHVDAAVERLIDARTTPRSTRYLRDPGDRAAPRAAASGADPHRHPARLRAEPDRAGLRRRPGDCRRGAPSGRRIRRPRRRRARHRP